MAAMNLFFAAVFVALFVISSLDLVMSEKPVLRKPTNRNLDQAPSGRREPRVTETENISSYVKKRREAAKENQHDNEVPASTITLNRKQDISDNESDGPFQPSARDFFRDSDQSTLLVGESEPLPHVESKNNFAAMLDAFKQSHKKDYSDDELTAQFDPSDSHFFSDNDQWTLPPQPEEPALFGEGKLDERKSKTLSDPLLFRSKDLAPEFDDFVSSSKSHVSKESVEPQSESEDVSSSDDSLDNMDDDSESESLNPDGEEYTLESESEDETSESDDEAVKSESYAVKPESGDKSKVKADAVKADAVKADAVKADGMDGGN